MTQNEYLIKRFRSGKTITNLQAHYEGICCLSRRITELRRAGYDIKSPMITVKTRWGRKTRVAKYSLQKIP